MLFQGQKNAKKFQKWQQKETMSHHIYGEELMVEGFIGPLCLPADRINEMRGDKEGAEFDAYIGLSNDEVVFLLDNPHMEPTIKQLMTMKRCTGNSILWLLGYHVAQDDSEYDTDKDILIALNRRNTAEASLNQTQGNGLLGGIMRNNVVQRIAEANLEVSSAAAKAVQKQHLPLAFDQFKYLVEKPVYVEFNSLDDGTWGLCSGRRVITASGVLPIEGLGSDYRIYLTPAGR